MTVSLNQVKQQLHILHSDDDEQLGDLILQSESSLLRYVGEGYDEYADELQAAQIIWIRWRYYPDEEVEIDDMTKLPLAFVALAGPYRTPTIA